jgi:hypothetical protein
MSNIDEQKLKALLNSLALDMYNMVLPNAATYSVLEDMRKKIAKADLLTDQPACATVKHQKPTVPEGDGNFYQ